MTNTTPADQPLDAVYFTSSFEILARKWKICFFHNPNDASVYICAYYKNIRKYYIQDSLSDGTIVKYDEWIDAPTARKYWIHMTKEIGYKRIK